jgi:hypothetical protein
MTSLVCLTSCPSWRRRRAYPSWVSSGLGPTATIRLFRQGASAWSAFVRAPSLCFVSFSYFPLCFVSGGKEKNWVGRRISFERGRREALVLVSIWWLASMAKQSSGGPVRCPNPTGPILWSCLSWSCRCPNPTDELLSCTVRVDVPIQLTKVPSCMVCGPEAFRVLCSPSCAIDRPQLYGFRARFPL